MWQHWIHVLLFNGHRIFRHFSWCHLDAQVDIKFPAISHPNLLSLSSWALNFPPFPHYVVSMLKRTSKVPPFPTLTSFHCLNGHRIYRHFSWRSLNAQVDIKSPINVGLSVGDLSVLVGKWRWHNVAITDAAGVAVTDRPLISLPNPMEQWNTHSHVVIMHHPPSLLSAPPKMSFKFKPWTPPLSLTSLPIQ